MTQTPDPEQELNQQLRKALEVLPSVGRTIIGSTGEEFYEKVNALPLARKKLLMEFLDTSTKQGSAEAHVKARVFRLSALLLEAEDETVIPFTTSAIEISQKRERARSEATELQQELEAEGYCINADDPKHIIVMNELFLLYMYLHPDTWIDYSDDKIER